MAGVPLVGRRARTKWTTISNYVRTTHLSGANLSSRLWSNQFVTSCESMDHSAAELPKRYPSGAAISSRRSSHQFPASWSHGPLRSGPAQAPSIRLVRSALSQHVALHISASCQHKPQDRPSTCTSFLRFGAEAYTRRATDKHAAVNLLRDQRRGLRLLREPIVLHTPLLTAPDRQSRDPMDYGHRALTAHVGAPSLWSSLGRNRRCSWITFPFSFHESFQYTRYRMASSTYDDPSCSSIKLLRSLSGENSSATNWTQHGLLSDLSRSPAFRCVT